jgi:hypothetical protein
MRADYFSAAPGSNSNTLGAVTVGAQPYRRTRRLLADSGSSDVSSSERLLQAPLVFVWIPVAIVALFLLACVLRSCWRARKRRLAGARCRPGADWARCLHHRQLPYVSRTAGLPVFQQPRVTYLSAIRRHPARCCCASK